MNELNNKNSNAINIIKSDMNDLNDSNKHDSNNVLISENNIAQGSIGINKSKEDGEIKDNINIEEISNIHAYYLNNSITKKQKTNYSRQEDSNNDLNIAMIEVQRSNILNISKLDKKNGSKENLSTDNNLIMYNNIKEIREHENENDEDIDYKKSNKNIVNIVNEKKVVFSNERTSKENNLSLIDNGLIENVSLKVIFNIQINLTNCNNVNYYYTLYCNIITINL